MRDPTADQPESIRPDEAETIVPRGRPMPPRIDEAETLPPRGAPVVLAGRYRVVRQLGQGGMGSVWLAEDAKLDNRPVAVKMLPAVLAGKKSAYRQIKDEALMAMRLVHPNIAVVRAFEEDDSGNPFLVMDYVEGRALDNLLAEKGPLPPGEAVRLLAPVAAALDYAHAQGVVHRDVKPGNVIVRTDGTPFVLDFGIASEIRETMTRVTGKTSGGTLLYMSPEQLNGDEAKAAQDVYSFAAMAYECLAGHPPFSRGQVEWQIVNKVPPELPEGCAPEAVRRGVMAGLAKNPKERPASCADVLAGGGSPRGQRAEGPEKQSAGRPPARPGQNADAAAAALAREREARLRAEREAAQAREGRGRAAGWAWFLAILLAVAGAGGAAWWHQVRQERENEEKRFSDDLAQAWQEADDAQAEAQKAKRDAEAAREEAKKARAAAPQAPAGQPPKPKAAPAAPKRVAGDGAYEGAVTNISIDGVRLAMHWCPAGTFTMGSPDTEEGRYGDEVQHKVTLTRGFWMGETEVTQGQWKALMDETILDCARRGLQDDNTYDLDDGKGAITMRERWGLERNSDPQPRCGTVNDDVPVYNVSWLDAKKFCRLLTEKGHSEKWLPEAYSFRLPTEAEWEYACRAGTTTALPNGQDIHILADRHAPALDGIAWHGGNSWQGFKDEGLFWGNDTKDWKGMPPGWTGGRADARKVKGKARNEWRLYDMIGNVNEWCEDEFAAYPTGPVTNYAKLNNGTAPDVRRVVRGGSWFSNARRCRSASRSWSPAGFRGYHVGFRLVCSAGRPGE